MRCTRTQNDQLGIDAAFWTIVLTDFELRKLDAEETEETEETQGDSGEARPCQCRLSRPGSEPFAPYLQCDRRVPLILREVDAHQRSPPWSSA